MGSFQCGKCLLGAVQQAASLWVPKLGHSVIFSGHSFCTTDCRFIRTRSTEMLDRAADRRTMADHGTHSSEACEPSLAHRVRRERSGVGDQRSCNSRGELRIIPLRRARRASTARSPVHVEAVIAAEGVLHRGARLLRGPYVRSGRSSAAAAGPAPAHCLRGLAGTLLLRSLDAVEVGV